ncbi:hypothetical protein SCOCK_660034 [Actinacidiphila cocklensis]|uniref:Uncharacterized protein n=1 Tax=Actinacidiphila cocklensis TaxID=887465 RepID=A0A9W4GVD6_9ACTN|nr:hypothetical protein SCOCK_660034 [Actinacidiphila cocklensis]
MGAVGATGRSAARRRSGPRPRVRPPPFRRRRDGHRGRVRRRGGAGPGAERPQRRRRSRVAHRGRAAAAGLRRRPRPARRASRRPGRQPLPHTVRQLLPGGHRAGGPEGRRHHVAPAAARARRGAGADVHLPGPAEPTPDRTRHHVDLRVQRGRRPVRGQRALDRGAAGRPAARGRGAGAVPRRPGRPARGAVRGRHDHRFTGGDGPRRARRDARPGHERAAAALRPRLPGPRGHPRPVRLRVGLQVAERAGADHLRRLRRLLGTPQLVPAGTGQDRVPDRHAQAVRDAQGGPGGGRRGRLGAAPGHRPGRVARRRRPLAHRAPRSGGHRGHLAAVGVDLGRHPRHAPHRGTCHGPRRTHPDRRAGRHRPRRCDRLAFGGGRRDLTRPPAPLRAEHLLTLLIPQTTPPGDPHERPEVPPCRRGGGRGRPAAARDHRVFQQREVLGGRVLVEPGRGGGARHVVDAVVVDAVVGRRDGPAVRPRLRFGAQVRLRQLRRHGHGPGRNRGLAQPGAVDPGLRGHEGRSGGHPQQRAGHHRLRAHRRRLRQAPQGDPRQGPRRQGDAHQDPHVPRRRAAGEGARRPGPRHVHHAGEGHPDDRGLRRDVQGQRDGRRRVRQRHDRQRHRPDHRHRPDAAQLTATGTARAGRPAGVTHPSKPAGGSDPQ